LLAKNSLGYVRKQIQNAHSDLEIRQIMIDEFLPANYRPIEIGDSYQAHLDFSNALKNMDKYRKIGKTSCGGRPAVHI
jgi:hypothetical protein